MSILVYHSVSNESTAAFRPYTVTPVRFREHLSFLAENQYRVVTVSGLVRAFQSGASTKTVAITFDDAFQDFSTAALPALMAFGMTATLYIPTAFVGATSSWLMKEGEGERLLMTWAQVRAAAESEIECGAHSHTHRELDRLSGRKLEDEVQRSKAIIEEHLRKSINTFAYPFGFHDHRARAAVAKAGYESACAVGNLIATEQSNVFALPRLTVTNTTDVPRLRDLLISRSGMRDHALSEVKRHLWRAKRSVGSPQKQSYLSAYLSADRD